MYPSGSPTEASAINIGGHRAGHRRSPPWSARCGPGRPSGWSNCPGWRASPRPRCCTRSARRSGRSRWPVGTSRRARPRTSAATCTRRWTPTYGVRMIIGDVRGKGLEAVRLASIVLGSYRHVAYERADLRTIVADLDRAVARSVGDEDFVTVRDRRGARRHADHRQLWPPGAAAAAPRRGDPAGPADQRAAAGLHAGGASRGSTGSNRVTGSCCTPTGSPRRAGTASSSRSASGPGACSATAPSPTAWPRWRAR